MKISVIASGSNGNCCLVEDKDTSILIDAGKSGLELERRMKNLGVYPENVDALLLTHAHSDHVCGAGVISRRFNIPVYMTQDVYNESKHKIGKVSHKIFSKLRSFNIKSLEIRPVPTSHCVDSCGFVIDKFGLFTDTGKVTQQMHDILPKLKTILLESNHEIDMVVHGHYPFHLKNWILSDIGHLNNIDASHLIQEKGNNLQLALLAHLSGNNNTPELALKTYETIVKRKLNYSVCSRDKESGTWFV